MYIAHKNVFMVINVIYKKIMLKKNNYRMQYLTGSFELDIQQGPFSVMIKQPLLAG